MEAAEGEGGVLTLKTVVVEMGEVSKCNKY